MHGLVAIGRWLHGVKAPTLGLGDGGKLTLARWWQSGNRVPQFRRRLGCGMDRGDPPFGVLKRRQNGMPPPQEIGPAGRFRAGNPL
jgi:hypothetical protein